MFRSMMLGWISLVFLGSFVVVLAQDNSGRPPADAETDSYYAGIENYFRLSKADMADQLGHGVSEEEVPVALFIARRAGLDPDTVWSVHGSGLNWMQVAWHFELNPWIFFTPLPSKAVEHTPYEKAYGAFSSRADKVNLGDEDIVNLVNLKFISEEYGCPPEEVVRARTDGKTFREINDRYWGRKDLPKWDVDVPSANPSPSPETTPGAGRHGGRHRGGGGGMGGSGGGMPSPGADGFN